MRAPLWDGSGYAFCSVSSARFAGSSFTCAKRIPRPILRGLGCTRLTPKNPIRALRGGYQSEVKEEPAKRAGDTNGGTHPATPSGCAHHKEVQPPKEDRIHTMHRSAPNPGTSSCST
jgi:hypothetical protein